MTPSQISCEHNKSAEHLSGLRGRAAYLETEMSVKATEKRRNKHTNNGEFDPGSG